MHCKGIQFSYARLKNGRMMLWQCPSVCLSVRPSVRPSFPDFFSTCFEISIWNLVYAFSRWHDMSSLSFITIGSLWPSLQPKVGQTQFLQSWPYKSRWILQIWYLDGPLYTSRHKFRFFQKSYFQNFGEYFLYARLKNGRIMLWQCPSVCPSVRPSIRPSVRVFRTFFQRALRYQFETWYMHSVGGTTCRVWVSSQLGHFDLVYSQK